MDSKLVGVIESLPPEMKAILDHDQNFTGFNIESILLQSFFFGRGRLRSPSVRPRFFEKTPSPKGGQQSSCQFEGRNIGTAVLGVEIPFWERENLEFRAA